MEDRKFEPSNAVIIPAETAAALLKLGDGNAALLYLYLATDGADKSSADKVRELGWDSHTLEAAENRLVFAGIMPHIAAPEILEEALPAERADVSHKTERPSKQTGSQFYVLVQEIQRMLGKVLSSDDIIRLLGIYDTLKLPGEVILQLVRYCMTETERQGDTRAPSLRYIEKAAYTWEREGIFSLEAAEAYIIQRDVRRGEISVVRRAMQINDREFTPTERKYVESWLALGYDAQTIAIAYDRTVIKTGKLAMNYMNSIIVNWHDKGLHTVEEILEKDTKPEQSPAARSVFVTRPAPDKRDIERMEKFLENMKKAKE
ncbi:MAG: DnaD domain protein [Oscillospiraceae bacterium]|jgi:DnaD/phage-associated family protein|nr:DnaD domain protein [Oscillospiraceae bacterium]